MRDRRMREASATYVAAGSMLPMRTGVRRAPHRSRHAGSRVRLALAQLLLSLGETGLEQLEGIGRREVHGDW